MSAETQDYFIEEDSDDAENPSSGEDIDLTDSVETEEAQEADLDTPEELDIAPEAAQEDEGDAPEELDVETDVAQEDEGGVPEGLDVVPEPAEDQEADEDSDEQAADDDFPDDGRAWFVVHCYSGYENKVRHNLEQRIESMGMKDMIFDVVVPTEEEIEVKEGKRRTIERRVFPGYILVNMIMTEESWYVVRNTPGVTGFVGMGNTPIPLRPEEVSQIIKRMEAEAPRIKVTFKPGERVRIIDGPFNDFRGTVSEIDMERAKVRVMVNFFGRETPVELDFLQVEKS